MLSSSTAPASLEHTIRDIVARNVHAARQTRGLTLNGLSEMSGIGKATLSGIENQAGNPTIETVWQLAKALDVPFGQLVENEGGKRKVMVPGVAATLIDQQTTPQNIETYLLELAPHTTRKADGHMAGVKEHVVVLHGQMLVGVEQNPAFLQMGQTHSFEAEGKHIYRALDTAVRAIVTIVYPNIDQGGGSRFDLHRPWPQSDDEWFGLNAQVARMKLEISQGIEACRLSFDGCNLGKPQMMAQLRHLLRDESGTAQPGAQTFSLLDVQPSLLILSRPHGMGGIEAAPAAGATLQRAIALANRSSALWRPLEEGEAASLRQKLASQHPVLAAMAAEALTRHGQPSVPACIHPKRAAEKQCGARAEDGVLFEDRIDVDAYASYELVHPAYARQSVAIANQIAARCPSGPLRLLDVGTGPGLPLQMLMDLRPGLQATAVDPSEVAHRHLCRLFKDNSQVTPLKISITEMTAPQELRFDLATSVGASHHLDTFQFLQSTHRNLKHGALFLVADEMITPFSTREQRSANLVAHHLQYVLDTLVDLPLDALSEAELVLVELMRQQAPLAAYEARSGDLARAANRCSMLLRKLRNLALPEPVSHELVAFYRFHFLKLEALVAGLDYEVEQKTYPQRFAELAQHAGFQVCEHSRLYATHGGGEWDGGTHLFVLKVLP